MSTEKNQNKSSDTKKKTRVVLLVLVAIVLVLFFALSGSERSVQSFCDVYDEEDTRLESLPGDTYPSGVFNEDLSDASEFAASFKKLEKVAPQEIRADVATLQSIYEKIHEDLSQAITASLSGVGAEENVVDWIDDNCSEDS